MKELIKPGYIIEVSNQEAVQYFIALPTYSTIVLLNPLKDGEFYIDNLRFTVSEDFR